MQVIILDALKMQKPEETHRYLKDMIKLPDYYGFNLDALYDCLTEEGGLVLKIVNSETAEAYFQRVYEVMMDAAEENPDLYIELS